MVRISYLPEFLKQAKHLTKKYPSFPEDLKVLIYEITAMQVMIWEVVSGRSGCLSKARERGKAAEPE